MSKKLPQFSYYNWPEGKHRGILDRLTDRRENFASILRIDLADIETAPITAGSAGNGRDVSDYICWRNQPRQMNFIALIDIALDDITSALTRFMMALANLNALASKSALYNILSKISERDKILKGEIETLDPSVREKLAEHYPGGRGKFKRGEVCTKQVIEAAGSAITNMEKPSRGRPKNTINLATKSLTCDLATIYENYSPYRVSRSVVNKKVHGDVVSQMEGGNFLRFLECAIDALPKDFQQKVTKSGGSPVSSIRKYLDDLKELGDFHEPQSGN